MDQIMKNGILYPADTVTLPGGSGLIYEVIRVIDGAALFFQAHYDRFIHSGAARAMGAPLTYQILSDHTQRFIASMDRANFNFKVILDPGSGDLWLFENPSAYPDAAMYEAGVHTELMEYIREDPNAKITNQELADLAENRRRETGAYELLLVDASGHITEGARSNLFFVQNGELVTPPLHSVLPGVTRQKIVETAHALELTVRETEVYVHDLPGFTGAFISGTSPKILPIRSIGSLYLGSATLPLVRQLMAAFDEVVQKDLDLYRLQAAANETRK